MKSLGISNSTLFACFSSARPDLSPEDNVIAQELVVCSSRPYAKLIKLDILGPSSSRSTHYAALRPSPPSTMKVSPIRLSSTKPTKGELLTLVEALSWKSRSVKRKTLDSVEKDRPTWGKVLKLGSSSSSPSTHVRISGQALSPPVEAPKVLSSQPHSYSAAKAKSSL